MRVSIICLAGVLVIAAYLLVFRGGTAIPGSFAAPPDVRFPSSGEAETSTQGAGGGRLPPESDIEVAEWLEPLLYGPGGGAAGYAAVGAGLLAGRVDIGDACRRILTELAADNSGPSRLRNIHLTHAVLLQHRRPTEQVAALRRDYVGAQARSIPHSAMQKLLAGWPVDAVTSEKVDRLLTELASAQPNVVRNVMRQLLGLGPSGAKALADYIVGRTLRDVGSAMLLVHSLLDVTTDPDMLSMLLHGIAVTQWDEGVERASDPVNAIGVAMRVYMSSDANRERVAGRDDAIRSTLMQVASEEAVAQSVAVGVAVAIGLGGAGEENPEVAAFLGHASRSWPALGANTALVNLGHATDPASYLQLVPCALAAPRDRERMMRHASTLMGLTNALRRHPEQVGTVMPYLADAVRTWRSERFEILMCESVLGIIRNQDIRAAAPLLQELRESGGGRLSTLATEILEAWNR